MRFDNTLTQAQVRQTWNALGCAGAWSRPQVQDGLIFGLLLDTGLRPREAANLKWRNLSLLNDAGGIIEVPETYAKRGRARQVAMTTRLDRLICIWTHLRQQPVLIDCEHWLFPGASRYKPITVRTLQRAVDRWGRQHLGTSVHPYRLRHTYATQLLRVANLRVVQDALGHRSITSTQVYTHVQPQDILDGTRAYEAATATVTDAA